MQFNIGHAVLEVAVALGEVHLQQVAQEVLQVCREVGGEADLWRGGDSDKMKSCGHASILNP